MLKIIPIPFATDNYAYLLQSADKVAIVDAGSTLPIQETLQKYNLIPNMLFCTHYHSDHIAGNRKLQEQFPNLKIYAHKNAKEKIPEQTHFLQENDEVMLGKYSLQILETFGHTQSCISLYEKKEKILFSGDCLFLAGCGRILGGSIKQMYNSFEKLKKLDTATKIYFGHNYSVNNLKFAKTLEPSNIFITERIKTESQKTISASSTLQAELKSNPFMRLQKKEIQQSVEKQLGKVSSSLDLFTKIRYLKDTF